jgi:hypothetical protein
MDTHGWAAFTSYWCAPRVPVDALATAFADANAMATAALLQLVTPAPLRADPPQCCCVPAATPLQLAATRPRTALRAASPRAVYVPA